MTNVMKAPFVIVDQGLVSSSQALQIQRTCVPRLDANNTALVPPNISVANFQRQRLHVFVMKVGLDHFVNSTLVLR